MFLGCAVISDLYLSQAILLLNNCFTRSKNLMSSFKDKVTTETLRLELVIISQLLLYSMMLYQHTIFCPWSFKLYVGKSKVNQEISKQLLIYLSGIVTCTFKGGNGGRGRQSPPSGSTGGLAGRISVFSIVFVLYLNDLFSEVLSLA